MMHWCYGLSYDNSVGSWFDLMFTPFVDTAVQLGVLNSNDNGLALHCSIKNYTFHQNQLILL